MCGDKEVGKNRNGWTRYLLHVALSVIAALGLFILGTVYASQADHEKRLREQEQLVALNAATILHMKTALDRIDERTRKIDSVVIILKDRVLEKR